MFSVAGTSPSTSTFGRIRPTAPIAPMTAAAPDMSVFIVSMLFASFSESPPES
jgi:hypothetical protein